MPPNTRLRVPCVPSENCEVTRTLPCGSSMYGSALLQFSLNEKLRPFVQFVPKREVNVSAARRLFCSDSPP